MSTRESREGFDVLFHETLLDLLDLLESSLLESVFGNDLGLLHQLFYHLQQKQRESAQLFPAKIGLRLRFVAQLVDIGGKDGNNVLTYFYKCCRQFLQASDPQTRPHCRAPSPEHPQKPRRSASLSKHHASLLRRPTSRLLMQSSKRKLNVHEGLFF